MKIVELAVAFLITVSANATIAYNYPVLNGSGQPNLGNQTNWGFPLGMDFDVISPITITDLGVFDSGADGLGYTIVATLYDRDTQIQIAQLSFTAGNTGTLIGSGRFLTLGLPIALAPGFHGTIVAEGYGPAEPNGNTGISSPPFTPATLDSGGGAINFVGTSRYATTNGSYPNLVDVGPVNRYGAGTFQYNVTATIPEPGTAGLMAGALLVLMSSTVYLRRKRRN